jgi:hypothetical protein
VKQFHIICNLRTATGLTKLAVFHVGTDPQFAYDVFSKLNGNPVSHEGSILSMDLIELEKGLPKNLNIIECTLDDLAMNCKIITKEVFKQHALSGN